MGNPRRPTVSDPSALARLTEAQRVCLRLIYRHHSSKDIAREIGISPHSVDARVRSALQTLGLDSRVDAALALAAHEGESSTYQPSAYQSPVVADGAVLRCPAPASEGSETTSGGQPDIRYGTARDSGSHVVREVRAAFTADYPLPAPVTPSSLSRRTWGGRNDLTVLARAGVTMLIAIASAVAFGGILAGLAAIKALSN